MQLKRIAITGSSGTYGRGLIRAIRRSFPHARVLGIDIREPMGDAPGAELPDEFATADVSSQEVVATIGAFRPDTIIHLAFVLNPIHDEDLMYRVNVDGARNVLEAARLCGPARVLFSSSATAYGAWPDNPVPMTEDWPIRPCEDFRYAAHKAAVEQLLEEFRGQNREIAVSWTRPCIIYGPGMKNFLTTAIAGAWVLVLPDGFNTRLQFVHLDDLADATVAILKHGLRGPFNVGPPDWCSMRDIARLTGRSRIAVPLGLCRAWSAVWWKLRLPVFRFPPGMWAILRNPWIVSSERLTREAKFQFRHSSIDTLRLLLGERNSLRESEQPNEFQAPASPE